MTERVTPSIIRILQVTTVPHLRQDRRHGLDEEDMYVVMGKDYITFYFFPNHTLMLMANHQFRCTIFSCST